MSSMVPNILQSLTSQQHTACTECKATNCDATKAYNFVHITSVLNQQLQVNLHFFFLSILLPFCLLFFFSNSLPPYFFFSNSPPCPDKLSLSAAHLFYVFNYLLGVFSPRSPSGQLSTASPALQQNYHKLLHYS